MKIKVMFILRQGGCVSSVVLVVLEEMAGNFTLFKKKK